MAGLDAYVWDYNLDEAQFRSILAGDLVLGRLDRDWAAVRLIGFAALVREWPRWRDRVRSQSRKRGLDFLVEWLPIHHPKLL